MSETEKKRCYENVVKNLQAVKGSNWNPATASVGGGGAVPPGQKVTLTGKVLFEENKETPSYSYYYLETKEGVKISVTAWAGVPNPAGYVFAVDTDLPTGTAVADAHNTLYATCTAKNYVNANCEKERNLVKLIVSLQDREKDLAGRQTEFLGTICRKIKLRSERDEYAAGEELVIQSKLWKRV